MTRPRLCDWCSAPIPRTMRRDAVTCSQACRQARHRFNRAIGADTSHRPASAEAGRRLANADPPYPGLARRYYANHPDYAGEVDHAVLVDQLAGYDGWALSTSAAALPAVLEVCPDGVKVAAWHRGAYPHGAPAGPLSAWEPVIYSPPPVRRRLTLAEPSRTAGANLSRPAEAEPSHVDAAEPSRQDPEHPSQPLTDSLVFVSRPRLTAPGRVIGAKPAVFIRWVFGLLDARQGDTLDDLFPGSGGIARAWRTYTAAG